MGSFCVGSLAGADGGNGAAVLSAESIISTEESSSFATPMLWGAGAGIANGFGTADVVLLMGGSIISTDESSSDLAPFPFSFKVSSAKGKSFRVKGTGPLQERSCSINVAALENLMILQTRQLNQTGSLHVAS